MDARSFSRRADQTLEKHAVRAERYLAWWRAGLIVVLSARSLVVGPNVLDALELVIVLGLSGYVLWCARRRLLRLHHVVWMSTADALVVTVSVGANLFVFDGPYPGIVELPDMILLHVVVAAAGLRLNVRAVLLAWATCTVGTIALYVVDRRLHPALPPAIASLAMLEIALLAVGTMAAVIAARSRRMLIDHARSQSQRDRAYYRLSGLLRQSHDARSTLASAVLNAELVERSLAGAEIQVDAVRNLLDDLRQLDAEVRSVEARSLDEVSLLKSAASIDLGESLAALRRTFRHSIPVVEVRCPPATSVRFAGGDEGFSRVLRNLLENARTGRDGRGASRVTIEVIAKKKRVEILVSDDGPGFDPTTLTNDAWIPSTKESGQGVGLGLVRGLVTASGGVVELSNGEAGGARVLLTLTP